MLVIATGARPRRLPLELPRGVHVLRTLAHARALREELRPGARLVVVGGGLVGGEVASTALALGVHLTSRRGRRRAARARARPEVGLMLAERWRAHGVDVRLGASVAGLRPDLAGRVGAVELADGTEVRADAVLLSVGAEPERSLVPPRPAPAIILAGDVASPGHWTAAALDGARPLAGSSAFRRRRRSPTTPGRTSSACASKSSGRRSPCHRLELDGTDDSFAALYVDSRGQTRAAVLANRPAEAAALRRELCEAALPLAA